MNVYWKPVVNQMMIEDGFNQQLQEVEDKIIAWSRGELSLTGDLLETFVKDKVSDYKNSFVKIVMPFQTEEECRRYLNDFYEKYVDVIHMCPCDPWAWIYKLESMTYGEYDIRCIHVPTLEGAYKAHHLV